MGPAYTIVSVIGNLVMIDPCGIIKHYQNKQLFFIIHRPNIYIYIGLLYIIHTIFLLWSQDYPMLANTINQPTVGPMLG